MKVTIEQIESKIKGETYLVLPDGRTTLCTLTLENGYTIQGLSACVDIDNFDLHLGRKYAREDAVRQIWPLEGYLLAERMFEDKLIGEIVDSALQTNGDGIVKFKKPTTSHSAVKKVARKVARK
jgi:hypothetical protein